eukprot:gene4896-8703_t
MDSYFNASHVAPVLKYCCRPLSMWHRLFGGKQNLEAYKHKNIEHRKELLTKFKTLSPLQEFKRNKGKRCHAPTTLISHQEALEFPATTCETLLGRKLELPIQTIDKNKSSIAAILITFREVSKPMLETYITGIREASIALQTPIPIYRGNFGIVSSRVQHLISELDVRKVDTALRFWLLWFTLSVGVLVTYDFQAHGQPTQEELDTLKAVVLPGLMREGNRTLEREKQSSTFVSRRPEN